MNIVLTGGTSGLGYRTAQVLGKEIKNKLILIGSNKQKGEISVENLIKDTSNNNISFIRCELSSISEIMSLADKLKKIKIDILINNAGALFFSRNESKDKIEKTFALNHLSYFILTNLLLKYKVIKNGGRIVNVASGAHRGVKIDFNNLEMKTNYNGWIAYKKSKLCNILFTKKLSELTKKNKITVNCLHPGFVKTKFGKNNSGLISLAIKFLMYFFAISVEEGAKTIVYLATDNSIKNMTGKYFYQSKIDEPSIFAQNQKDADLLWQKSLSIVKNNGLTLREDSLTS